MGIAVGLWVPWLGVAAGTGVLLLMVGAFLAHARVHDPFAWYEHGGMAAWCFTRWTIVTSGTSSVRA